jgi:hypothetical protein
MMETKNRKSMSIAAIPDGSISFARRIGDKYSLKYRFVPILRLSLYACRGISDSAPSPFFPGELFPDTMVESDAANRSSCRAQPSPIPARYLPSIGKKRDGFSGFRFDNAVDPVCHMQFSAVPVCNCVSTCCKIDD